MAEQRGVRNAGITMNDLDLRIVNPGQFSLVVFDEAHLATGEEEEGEEGDAYSGMAERFAHWG